jgi:formylglycine-generating enzyme required for sulfatase activity
LLTAYLADSYYLTIDPFYEPQLFEIFKEQEQAALQPFIESLREFQVAQRTAYYQELARIEAEHSERKQAELERQRKEIQKNPPISVDLDFNVQIGLSKIYISANSGIKLDLLYIPGGSFSMGSTDHANEQPQHQVNIQSFHMGKYPITQAQYQAVMGNNPACFKGDNLPVEQVSWDDAIAFCQKLSQRTGTKYTLPSESQWEYACRAGTTTFLSFGDNVTAKQAIFVGKTTTNVGTFRPNAFGLYDMYGNVWEWCLDTWHENYNGAPTDGSAWIDNDSCCHLLRGGSWYDFPDFCRSSDRSTMHPDDNSSHYLRSHGFRVVCPLSPRFP